MRRGNSSRGRENRYSSRNNAVAGPSRRRENEIYDVLLEEALRQGSRTDNDRPLKKRKSRHDPNDITVIDDPHSAAEAVVSENQREVIVIESSRNSTDNEDDMEWDDVDLTVLPTSEEPQEIEPASKVREVTLNAQPQKPLRKKSLGTPRTSLSRRIRLEAHKMYLLSLLSSFRHLNLLLSSPSLHKILRPYVPPAIVNALNAGPEHNQARRSISFLSGLRDIAQSWSDKWRETNRGWRRPRWVDPEDLGKIPEYLDLSAAAISMEMLNEAARTRSGSRDVGAWLFTSLLRSVGVETRLVCSLQPLQFGFQSEGSRQKFVSDSPEQMNGPALDASETGKPNVSSTAMQVEGQQNVETRPTRNPSFPSSSIRQTGIYETPAQYIKETKTFSPNHPFFWSEAWDVASQKWIVVEPMVGVRVNQPSRIEPPSTAAPWETGAIGDNILSYAVGFDNSGFAKDVTKRYAKAYYAKTWRHRIESQEGGEKWWKRVIQFLDRMEPLDRDQLEEIDLSNHLLKEPVPKKIDDFRGHPLYVLDRHLRRNEVLRPGATPVGALTSGKGMNLKTENIFKRRDVVPCYSAREWFRKGRIVKKTEQPIKHTSASSHSRGISKDEEDELSEPFTPLYSEMQTELYIPPPVENGIVPKNAYGNIDVYTPSMVPAGGVHVIRPSIAHAARFAGIDYADAVSGFDFVRNKANARITGIVVAQENLEGLLTIWEGMMERVRNEEERLRIKAVLERWKKFFVGMEIRKRLDDMHGKVKEVDEIDVEVKGDIVREAFQSDIENVRDFNTGLPHEEQLPQNLHVGQIPHSDLRGKSHLSTSINLESNGTLPAKDGKGSNRYVAELDNPLNSLAQPLLHASEASDVEISGGGFLPDNESEGGGFCPPGELSEASEYSDDFSYEEEDGIL